jgi:hypothetical protein
LEQLRVTVFWLAGKKHSSRSHPLGMRLLIELGSRINKL